VTRVLLPLAFGFAVLLAGLGVIENLSAWHTVTTLAGGQQAVPGGLVASWESIKLMSGDGGGFFNANSAHPFENPSPLTNIIEITLMLLVPVACIRMFGRLAGDRRQGWALLAVAGVLFTAWMAVTVAAESHASGTAPAAAHSAMEGKETAFGVPGSAAFGVAATSSADGAANASYDSFTALGGGLLMSAMMLGEVSPGGVGSGLYGLLMIALVAVFLGGLMVSRTPTYLRKRIRAPEMKMVALYYLATPTVLLAGAAVAIALPAGRTAILNPGAHGLSECCTPSPARPTATAARSAACPAIRPSTTRCWPWSCCWAGTPPWCSSSGWPGPWPGSGPPRPTRARCAPPSRRS
jgi:K+-transporting ATPase ATPase A chain